LLAVLLASSILLKIPGSLDQEEIAAPDVEGRVSAFLGSSGFTTEANFSDEDLFMVSATAGQCRLLVALASPHGWHRHLIRQLAPTGGKVLFLYDGRSYDDQPVLRTRVYDYWSRWLRFLGGDPSPRPVYGVVGSPECAMDTLPWEKLADGYGDGGSRKASHAS
jgi:hypothetical protein